MRLGKALATLQLTEKEHGLIEEAIEAEWLRSDSGDTVPCGLDVEKATELANKADRNKKAFKLAIAGMLFGEHISSARGWRWYRDWTRKENEILPNTEILENRGIQPYAIQDVRDKLRFALYRDGQPEDGGEVTQRVNLLTRDAGWQVGLHRSYNDEATLMNAAQAVIEEAGLSPTTAA
jgi:hypothetical protein